MKFSLILNYITCSKKLLGEDAYNILINYIFKGIQIAVPILLILLIMKDMASAAMAQDEKAMDKAKGDALKRIAIAVVIAFLPVIINLILNLVGVMNGKC